MADGKVKLRYVGAETVHDHDKTLGISLTVKSGDVVEVSHEKAEELQKSPLWTPFKPKPSAGSAGVPGGQGGAASTTEKGGAMHTGAEGQKSDAQTGGAGGPAGDKTGGKK
jgi:hypothetical protein